MANTLLQNQVYQILNAINAQAKGGGTLTAVDTSSFVTVGQTLLKTGYDNVISAISQVLSDTIFSHRPYDAILDILYADTIRYGNHVRKLVPLDDEAVQNDEFLLTDGQSVDQYVINKPKVKQFNFYGSETFARFKTLFRTQLDVAFSNEGEFARFIAMIVANLRDQLTQDMENMRRMALSNYVAGVSVCNPGSVVNLLTEYNRATGLSLTTTTVNQPANYGPFIRWASARIMNVSDELRQRGYRWHKNLTGVNIPRHTPREYQRLILFSPEYRRIENSALAETWHTEYVRGFDAFESINFFQNPDVPNSVKVTPSIIDNDGEYAQGAETTVENIFGVLFDRDALGQTNVNEWQQSTPINARAGYYNMWYHRTVRWWNDFTENGVIFTLN